MGSSLSASASPQNTVVNEVLQSSAGSGALVRGDAVHVLSLSLGAWIEDGIVVEVAAQDCIVQASHVPGNVTGNDGLVTVPRGSVYVTYNHGSGNKWILPSEVPQHMR